MRSHRADSYVYGPAQRTVEQVNSSTGAVEYLHHDQQGSTQLITGKMGEVLGSYSYSPYGEVTGHEGSATTPLGYDGQYTNSDTGLQYLWAREYEPATGEFMTEDPVAALTGVPYGYAHDNPQNYYDPSGLFSIGEIVGSVEHGVGEGLSTLGSAAGFVGEWIYENRTPIGIGLGALSLASGVGAIADVGALADLPALTSLRLGVTSAVSGLGAAGLDGPGCIDEGHISSCVALGLGAPGAGFGLGGTLLDAGILDGPLALQRVLEYGGLGLGSLGLGVELANLLEKELGAQSLRQLQNLVCG
jgi:RHS repeat-associated protein